MENETKRLSPKRLVVDIYDDLHQKIKLHSTKRNISIRKWVMRALIRAIADEENHTRQ